MSRIRKTIALAVMAGVPLGLLGCQSYRYMREPTPDIEHARKEYVVNNPGNRYNDDIIQGRVRTGMSRLQVRITWGDPDRIEPNGPGGNEVWAYQESEVSRGLSIYWLRFVGEQLARLDVERAVAEMPSTRDPKTQTPPIRPDRGSEEKPRPER